MTVSKTISYQTVVHQTGGLIGEKHGYIYPAVVGDADQRACRYWHQETNSPGCIIGIWGHSLGLGRNDLLQCENQGAVAVVEALERYGYIFEDRMYVAMFLQCLQSAQDSGATWGYAYDNAVDMTNLRRENHRLSDDHDTEGDS